MLGTLGCAENYQILVASKEGIVLGDLTAGGNSADSVTWGRKLDDFSEATVVIPLNNECCEIISILHTWHCELQIFRDGAYVWSGPIVNIVGSRTQVTIKARDLMALLDKRSIHTEMCFAEACGGAASDLTILGTALINDALIVDGHNYLIQSELTGIIGERLYRIGDDNTTLNSLQEAMQLGLDVTVLGRKFVLGAANGGAPFGTTNALTCDDFLTDLEFEEDGLSAATRALTLGNGFVGLAKAVNTDVNGEHPYYGLLEYISLNRGELNTQALADQGAQAVIASLFPPPTNLVTPNGAMLSATAPVTIAELVPGVYTPIILDCVCRPTAATMVLIEMSVSWTPSGEQVSVTYASLGSENSGEQNS